MIAGVMFGLLSGQPLTMLGLTGPDLVFESLVFLSSCLLLLTFKTKVSLSAVGLQVYQFCSGFGWEYLSFRIWIGLWLATMLIILVATDARSKLFTHFTSFSPASLSATSRGSRRSASPASLPSSSSSRRCRAPSRSEITFPSTRVPASAFLGTIQTSCKGI